ncbi:phosphatidylglycerol lysyltransferase domain-containing protein [Saccharomonospora sp. NPDC046836]|uniref:phosphatidylglycerol lysyltransferase domain-containing protein n=1 Tax=Saccharomonospora sp. NPDC046836 TaxID=3156921 RepID=UPI0033DCAD54
MVGLLVLVSAIVPTGRMRLRPSLLAWLGLGHSAHVAAGVLLIGGGVLLLGLANALARGKRRAWQLATMATGFIAALNLLAGHRIIVGLAAAALCVVLAVTRREFRALPDPALGRWRAPLLFAELLAAGVVINFLILLAGSHELAGAPSLPDKLAQATYSLVGFPGPIQFSSHRLADLTTGVGLLFGISALLVGAYALLRSGEPAPSLPADEEHALRGLLREHGAQDSLGYFTLRRDKSAVFSPTGKSAVTYRVLAGVALASGDPLGDPEAWPGAITAFLEICRRYGWVPAVLGCSEAGVTAWNRHGLDALELGDEAIVDTTTFTLEGRPMRGVRQMAARARRAGYAVRVRRVGELDEAEQAQLRELARRWRGTNTERGFSMALGRTADVADPECVLVTAERDDTVHAMLQLVPWGTDGLSLDLMRRDRSATDTGLNELMIAELLQAAPGLEIRQVSLNFAVQRAALERGQRIGAGPVARLWARVLRISSRWWQIDTLYRFNAKFRPSWVPRYLAFPALLDLPRVAFAALEAEGLGGRPPALLRLLGRTTG